MASATSIRLPPLSKQRMAELVKKARRLGVEPREYAKRLVEQALAFQREAETLSFAQIMAPVRDAAGDVEDAEIIKLVETARSAHHGSRRRKR
jgi:predicted DNA-binding protein